MRKYQPAWVQLRDAPDHPLIISAHPAYHRRIYKAITKEKHLDKIHHLELAEKGFKSILSRESKGAALIIRLSIIVPVSGLFV